MKKKVVVIMLAVVVFACSIALAGCSLVKVNEERQAGRVISTVSVDLAEEYGDGVKILGNDWNYTVTLTVTRRELISTVNYAISYYSQLYSQYGYTYDYDLETLLDTSLSSLNSQKYYTIRAMGELLLTAKETGRYDSLYCLTDEYRAKYGKTLVPEGVLTLSERYDAIKTTNDQLESQLETYLTDTASDERDKETSEANDVLYGYYNEGYFVDSVSIAKKTVADDGTVTYSDGLYATSVVDDNDDDTDDLDYTDVYAKIKLVKSGADDVYAYSPISDTALTLAEEDDAAFAGKYVTVKTAVITYSGRVYAEITDDNTNGYDVESFTSPAVEYNLVAPRSVYSSDDDDDTDDDTLDAALRYYTTAQWNDEASYTQAMTDLKTDIFDPSPDSYVDSDHKDAYRQLRNAFSSANIGYTEENPGKDDDNYVNYAYFNGLKYYYDSQFSSAVLSAKEYELSKDQTVSDADITVNYQVLVAKDKANYDGLSYSAQVTQFFDTVESDLTTAYYVPIDALLSTTYEVDPTDKRYEALFTFDTNGDVTGYNSTYVKKSTVNGKDTYTMTYAYANADGTYTINIFYVAHILLSFDNVDGLSDELKSTYSGFTDEQKLLFIKKFVAEIQTCPQLESYLANYDPDDDDKVYGVSEVFDTNEDGSFKYITEAEADSRITSAIDAAYADKDYEALLAAFTTLTEVYNDDSGKLSGSGYRVSAGDMENGWQTDFTATALKIYFGLLNSNKKVTGYTAADDIDLNDLVMKAYSEYGVHYMFISFAPLCNVTLDADGGIGLYTALDITGKTWYATISDSLLSAKKTNNYTEWKASMTEDAINAHTVKNDKNYKNLVKDETKDSD